MDFDGAIHIATGLSAKTKTWKNERIFWSSLATRLCTEYKTSETYKQFIDASKEDQTKIKDVGGYVGGFIRNGRRNPQNIASRQLITLDIDFGDIDLWSNFCDKFNNAAVIHGTHKYTEETPRYRLVMPISREVSSEEYMAISRWVAGQIGIDLFDNTTFEVNRLMFWPSTPIDIDYYSDMQDGPWIDADDVLAMYEDWHDTSKWPTAEVADKNVKENIDKQEDPREKKGVIGMFCRTYGIKDAIETFLNEVYVFNTEDRYTYTKGSTAGGLIIYDDTFAYSHHGTDPCCNRTSNAFDLVRIHKYGYLDSGTEKKDTDKKSFKRMEELVLKDDNVKLLIANEKLNASEYDTKFTAEDTWITDLKLDTRGTYLSTAPNINLIVQNDTNLKDSLKYNRFDNKRYITKSMPWRIISTPEPLRDVDYSGIRNYVESVYEISASSKIDDSLALEFERNAFHPIVDFLDSLTWDKVSRIDNLLVDYFGAPKNVYTAEAIRKPLCAAVARVYAPGTKFDLVLTLVGGQGTGKSTFVKKLGKQWFSDTFLTVQGKEAFEQIQGAWLIEMAELSGLRKAETETIKQFITKCEDMYRPAYGRTVETYKRQCVFFGTTNSADFLNDPSGNRRFIPIDVCLNKATKDIWEDLSTAEIDQIWAEAVHYYKLGELLYMSKEAEEFARTEQHKHSAMDERKGIVEDYLNKLLPSDWSDKDLDDRRRALTDPLTEQKIKRMHVCIAEIWCECLGKPKEEMSRYNTREINDIMKTMHTWEYNNSTKNFGFYGKQKFYSRRID